MRRTGSLTSVRCVQVSVLHCYAHLPCLVHLTSLTLDHLAPPGGSGGDDLDAHSASCAAMLRGMTGLQRLCVQDARLNAREAMAVFFDVLPSMTRLVTLELLRNELRAAPCIVLANKVRDLPALEAVYVSNGNELPGPESVGEGTLEDLNWLAGRPVFR